ncbi:MAG: hypothetical protein ABI398_00615 [Devosia sp.]
MLQYCAAIICSTSPEPYNWMGSLADQVGFGRVSPHDQEWPQVPVVFFLVHAAVPEDEKARLISTVRGNGVFRFSPIMLVSEEGKPRVRTLVEYHQAGFDDAVTVDGDLSELTARIKSQLNDEQVYYSTPTYFGPDRRRWERQPTRTISQLLPYERYRIRRDALTGIRAIEHQSFGQTAAPDTPAARVAQSGRY